MRLLFLAILLAVLAAPASAQRAAPRSSGVVVTYVASIPADPSKAVPDILETIVETDGYLGVETREESPSASGRRATVPKLKIRAVFAFESLEAFENWVEQGGGKSLVPELRSQTPSDEFTVTIRMGTADAPGRGPN